MSTIKYFLKVFAILGACFATIAIFNGILGELGYIIAFTVILVGIGVVCYRREKKSKLIQAHHRKELQENLTSIKRAYDSISLGMNYSSVSDLLGQDGEVYNENILPSGAKQKICVWEYGTYFTTAAVGRSQGEMLLSGSGGIGVGATEGKSSTKTKHYRKITIVFENDRVVRKEQAGFSKQDIEEQILETV